MLPELHDEVEKLMAQGYSPNEAATEVAKKERLLSFEPAGFLPPMLVTTRPGVQAMIDYWGTPYDIQKQGEKLVLPEIAEEKKPSEGTVTTNPTHSRGDE